MLPRVLIADQLSPAAVAIFKQRGVDTDVKIGLSKDELEKIIGGLRRPRRPLGHQGRPRRCSPRRTRLKVIGRAGIGVDNIDVHGRHRQGHHRDEHALRQFHHHRRARHLADDGARPPDPRGRPLHAGRQVGEVEVHGRRAVRQDARRDRLRQHRLDRRRPRHRPQDEGRRLRSRSSRRSGPWSSASRRSSSTSCCAAPTSSRCTRRSPTRPATSSTPRRWPRPRRACASSTARAAAWSTRRALAAALKSGHVGRRRLRRVRGGAGQGERAVRPAQRHLHAASGRLHQRGAGERGPAGGRADVGLPARGAPSPTPSTSPPSPPRRRRASSPG